MPIKNTAAYLRKCIDSIIEQTYTDWELIAIDDHSDDDSYKILQLYAAKYSHIHTYKNEGKGIINALRLAFANSQGQYITRMDSDDIMMPQKIDLLRAALTDRKQVSVGLVQYFSDDTLGEGYIKYADWLNKMTINKSNFSEIYKECVIPSPCWMIHRDDFIDLGSFASDIYPEDYDLAFRMRNYGLVIRPVPEIIHLWRDHPSRASRNDPNYMDNQFINIKVHHFLLSDYNASQPLVVWGAGKKGKKIVQLLKVQNIDVHWICNNTKKIGTKIYDILLHAPHYLDAISSPQIIIAVAQKNAQTEIESTLQQNGEYTALYFC